MPRTMVAAIVTMRNLLRRVGPGLVLGLLVLGPVLAPGFVLSYDMVFVPDPPIMVPAGGFPRQVPSDTVVAVLATVLPAQVVQRLLLLGIFVLAAWGAARLVPVRRPLPQLAAAVCYVWNPYVAERLLLGHWALLLGYAGLPWALTAAVTVAQRGGVARLTRFLVPAAIGGFAAMIISGLVVGCTALCSGSTSARVRALLLTLPVLAGLGLPWLVPALVRRGGATDPAGVDLFAARADTPFGSVGSLLSLGGIWNAEVVPPGYGAAVGAAGRLLLSIAAIVAYAWLVWPGWRQRRHGSATGPPSDDGSRSEGGPLSWGRPQAAGFRGLALAAAAGFAIACLGITEPGRALLRALIAMWPGFGVLRDAQLYIAPLALLEAVGLGALVAVAIGASAAPAAVVAVAEDADARDARRDHAGVALGVLLVAGPIALLPTLAWGVSGRLDTADYPADWTRMRAIVERDPVPGAVLSLPWAAHRPWTHGGTVLDPLPKMLARRVVWNDGLRVGTVDLAAEDQKAAHADVLLRAGGPLTEALRVAGYRYAVVQKIEPADGNRFQPRLAGSERVLDGSDLVVYRIPASPAGRGNRPIVDPVPVACTITLLLTLWSFGASGSTLLELRRTRR